MAEHHPSEGSSTSHASAESCESTVELNIKTLDSQMYSFHVDKNIPVSVFKEKIASKIGVPVGQQRLIFRGKVLKDKHLLSEYHLDNGHTLHLVVRQPSQPQSSSGNSTEESTAESGNRGMDAIAGGLRTRLGQVSQSVVPGTLNIGEQGESAVPDLNRVIGAVLNSLGIENHTLIDGSGGVQPAMQFNAPAQAPQGSESEGRRGIAGNESQAGNQSLPGNQHMAQIMQIPLGAAIPLPSLNVPIPHSLHTLSEFMNRMELAMAHNGDQPNQSSNNTRDLPPVNLPVNSQGLPTPEAFTVVLRHAQRLLSDHAVNVLSHIAGRVEQVGDSADPTVRSQIQTESMQAGLAMQHLGALLLELGRTMTTLRLGQSSSESSVNAGPAVYISPSGPNPIMVQPFPLQNTSLFGGPISPPLNLGAFVPGGAGPIPRHVNIHIYTAAGPRASNGEGMQQGDRVSGTVSGDSGQTRVLPMMNIFAAAVPSRPSAVSVSSAAQHGGALSQQSPSGPLSTVMAEVNSQFRSLVDNIESESRGSPVSPESLVIQDQSAESGAGSGEKNDDIRSLIGSIGETSLPLPGSVSEAESQVAQAESHKPSNKEDTEGAVMADVTSSSSVKGVDNQSSEETVHKSVDGTGCGPRSNPGADNSEGATTTPLGLGMGGLHPKRRNRQSRLQGMIGDGATFNASPTVQNQHARSGQQALQLLASLANRGNASNLATAQLAPTAGGNASNLATAQLAPTAGGVAESTPVEGVAAEGQFDPASIMSQVLHSPALDGLLAGVSQQTGVSSPDVLRNMLGQLTQSPAMMNTVNQIAQQIDGPDFGSMFSGLGSGRSGGIDLSRMVQQMMPIVSQALGSVSNIPQQAPPVAREVQSTHNEGRPSRDERPNDQNSQVDLQQVVQKLKNEDPPKEVLRSVVESVVSSHDYGGGVEGLVNDLCSEDDLAREFMEMLHRDISRRVQDETGSAWKS